MPYNGSIFNLRSQYKSIFGKQIKNVDFDHLNKINKIKYTLNLLPNMKDADDDFMEIIGDTEQTEIFQTKGIKSLIEFKWTKYASKVHYMSAFIHFIYVLMFFFHVQHIYI